MPQGRQWKVPFRVLKAARQVRKVGPTSEATASYLVTAVLKGGLGVGERRQEAVAKSL